MTAAGDTTWLPVATLPRTLRASDKTGVRGAVPAAAAQNRLRLADFREWWDEEDEGKPPRVVSFMFMS